MASVAVVAKEPHVFGKKCIRWATLDRLLLHVLWLLAVRRLLNFSLHKKLRILSVIPELLESSVGYETAQPRAAAL